MPSIKIEPVGSNSSMSAEDTKMMNHNEGEGQMRQPSKTPRADNRTSPTVSTNFDDDIGKYNKSPSGVADGSLPKTGIGKTTVNGSNSRPSKKNGRRSSSSSSRSSSKSASNGNGTMASSTTRKRDPLSNSDHAVDWDARRRRQKESEKRNRRRHRSRSEDLVSNTPPLSPNRQDKMNLGPQVLSPLQYNGPIPGHPVVVTAPYTTSPHRVAQQQHRNPRSLPTSPMAGSPYHVNHPQYQHQNAAPVVSQAGNPLIPILYETAPVGVDSMPLLSSKNNGEKEQRRNSGGHNDSEQHQRKRKTGGTASYGSMDTISPGGDHHTRSPNKREQQQSKERGPISPNKKFSARGEFMNLMTISGNSPNKHRQAASSHRRSNSHSDVMVNPFSPHQQQQGLSPTDAQRGVASHHHNHRRSNSHPDANSLFFSPHNQQHQFPVLPFAAGINQEVLSPTDVAAAPAPAHFVTRTPRGMYQKHFEPMSLRNIPNPPSSGAMLMSEPRAAHHQRSLSDSSGGIFFTAGHHPRPPISPSSAGASVLSGRLAPSHAHRGVYSAPDGPVTYDVSNTESGDESDPFIPKKFGDWVEHRGSKNQGSSRRMHMRHKSVELFMKNVRGSEQPKRCRDVFFALLFLVQLALVIFIGVKYGADAIIPASEAGGGAAAAAADALNGHEAYYMSSSEPEADGATKLGVDGDGLDENTPEEVSSTSAVDVIISYQNVIKVAFVCGAFAISLSALALVFMMVIARKLVQVALVLCIVLSFTWGTVGIGLNPKNFVPITGIIALALSIGYAFVVWERIPFAASNLTTALSGIRDNPLTVFVAFLFQALALCWSLFFTFVVIGVYDALQVTPLDNRLCILIYVGLGISYYWTYQVIVHIVGVTTAGTIGSWWFNADRDNLCSPVPAWKSFSRSTFFSFGSVCLGSLLVGFVQVLRQITENFRPNRDGTVLMCLQECLVCAQECIVGCVDKMSDSFNPWAFTYVGLYGYGFMEAGHNATELFKTRGWTKIITDDLIPNVLFMVSVIIGGVTGFFGQLVQENEYFGFSEEHNPAVTSFLIGLCVGLVVSSVLLIIISSSASAVIVCFAGSPVEFQKNHTQLSNEMREAWREVWPGCMDVTDLKISLAIGDVGDNV